MYKIKRPPGQNFFLFKDCHQKCSQQSVHGSNHTLAVTETTSQGSFNRAQSKTVTAVFNNTHPSKVVFPNGQMCF